MLVDYKCPTCHKVVEKSNELVMVICQICVVEMREVKSEREE